MAKLLRVKCSCGNVSNALPGAVCSKCGKPLEFSPNGLLRLYRKGSPLGVAVGFGIYLNGEPYGHIGNKETVDFPLPYGQYRLHVAQGMNRGCTDLIIDLNPQNRVACCKVWIKPGFWTNSFVLEPAHPSEMPE